jgi:hypothetical protein
MSSPRIEPNAAPAPVEAPKIRQAPSTPFGQVLAGNTAVVSGTQSNSGLVGGPVLAAAVRETGSQVLGGVIGGAVGGGGVINTPAGPIATSSGPGEMSQMHAMQRESQAFNLQLLNLQTEVQDENRRFTTISNVLKSAHDTAKAAVGNIRS